MCSSSRITSKAARAISATLLVLSSTIEVSSVLNGVHGVSHKAFSPDGAEGAPPENEKSSLKKIQKLAPFFNKSGWGLVFNRAMLGDYAEQSQGTMKPVDAKHANVFTSFPNLLRLYGILGMAAGEAPEAAKEIAEHIGFNEMSEIDLTEKPEKKKAENLNTTGEDEAPSTSVCGCCGGSADDDDDGASALDEQVLADEDGKTLQRAPSASVFRSGYRLALAAAEAANTLADQYQAFFVNVIGDAFTDVFYRTKDVGDAGKYLVEHGLHETNAMFFNKNLSLKKSFKDSVIGAFEDNSSSAGGRKSVTIEQLKGTGTVLNSKAGADQINHFVDESTYGLIKKLVGQKVITEDTVLSFR